LAKKTGIIEKPPNFAASENNRFSRRHAESANSMEASLR